MFVAAANSGMEPSVWLSSKDNREQYGYGDYSATQLTEAYNKWDSGTDNLAALRNIVTSSPTYTAAQKADLAMTYYDRGAITYNQMKQFLKENGIEI
jgi:hypothetical protein